MSMERYRVDEPLRLNGKRVEPGKIVEIDDVEGADLVRRGVLSPAPVEVKGEGDGKGGKK